MSTISRRQMIAGVGGVIVGGAVATALPAMAAPSNFAKTAEWIPHKVDPTVGERFGYDGYYHKGYGCCYGAFYAIVGQMAEQHGAPYKDFPFHMMEVGKSGISNWATICGALLGAASAFSLFYGRKERKAMVDELFRWYEQTAFPIYKPTTDIVIDKEIPTSVSNSVLCHVSVSRWSYSSGIPAKSKVRSERCGRLTADVAKKAIEILNAKIDGKFEGLYGKQESVKYCDTCHGNGKESPIAKGKQDCTPCHSGSEATENKFKDHP